MVHTRLAATDTTFYLRLVTGLPWLLHTLRRSRTPHVRLPGWLHGCVTLRGLLPVPLVLRLVTAAWFYTLRVHAAVTLPTPSAFVGSVLRCGVRSVRTAAVHYRSCALRIFRVHRYASGSRGLVLVYRTALRFCGCILPPHAVPHYARVRTRFLLRSARIATGSASVWLVCFCRFVATTPGSGCCLTAVTFAWFGLVYATFVYYRSLYLVLPFCRFTAVTGCRTVFTGSARLYMVLGSATRFWFYTPVALIPTRTLHYCSIPHTLHLPLFHGCLHTVCLPLVTYVRCYARTFPHAPYYYLPLVPVWLHHILHTLLRVARTLHTPFGSTAVLPFRSRAPFRLRAVPLHYGSGSRGLHVCSALPFTRFGSYTRLRYATLLPHGYFGLRTRLRCRCLYVRTFVPHTVAFIYCRIAHWLVTGSAIHSRLPLRFVGYVLCGCSRLLPCGLPGYVPHGLPHALPARVYLPHLLRLRLL